jgi:hypothetical protein
MLKPRFDPLRFSRPLGPTQEERRQRIADRAFTHAARRGFISGHELDDWLTAEREVDCELSGRYLGYYG